jgi:hypothetical protein
LWKMTVCEQRLFKNDCLKTIACKKWLLKKQ